MENSEDGDREITGSNTFVFPHNNLLSLQHIHDFCGAYKITKWGLTEGIRRGVPFKTPWQAFNNKTLLLGILRRHQSGRGTLCDNELSSVDVCWDR